MKKIIILEAVSGSAQGYRYALWVAVPAARQSFYVKPSTWVSKWTGASSQENIDLRSGAFTEKVDLFNNPTALTLAQVKTQLETVWQAYQDFVTAYNPWDRYGSYYEGTSWTNAGAS